jgi:hypothetical protein
LLPGSSSDASHFSYLSAGAGLIACLLGIRLVARGRSSAGALWIGGATWHLGTAGSPEHLIFGAHVLVAVWVYHLVRGPARLRFAAFTVAAVATGTLLALPAALHFLHQLPRSQRTPGLSVDVVLQGSLPAAALMNLVAPFMKGLPRTVSLDPTMDRFHLLAVSPVLVLAGLWLWRRMNATYWVALVLAVLFTLLALGAHSPIPIRGWLAEQLFLYRVGRAPAGQHRGFALFCLALASAIVLDRAWRAVSPRLRTTAAAVIAADFMAVMALNSHVRYGVLPDALKGELPRCKVVHGPPDQPLLDAPRDCSASSTCPRSRLRRIHVLFRFSS